ncbi:PIG-L deacetylase family protein [Actinoplanes sp. GCM10030250]|uniref:PIG-L deacetylase family protein n=1 Tax=Actinoplanes sp. GCM10030250 TaxID=3273376 RepID=UPI0036068AE2
MRQSVRRRGRQLLAVSGRQWRRAVTARAERAVGALADRSLMVIAPHADDETLGCGALIARARARGVPVTVVVATDGRHSTESSVLSPDQLAALRTAELAAACTRLGVPDQDVRQLGFADTTLTRNAAPLTEAIAALHAERRPEVALVPAVQDDHPDHRAVHHATLRALDAAGHRCLVLAYPVWAWHSGPWFLDTPAAERPALCAWAVRQAVRGGWWRVPCGPYLRDKEAAIRAYASQTTNLTGEPSWSYLDADFLAAFREPEELFLPVRTPGRRKRR